MACWLCASLAGLYSLIIYFMGQEINHGWTDFQDSLRSYMAITLAAMGMAQATRTFPDLGNAKSAVQRIFPILDRKPVIDSSSEGGKQPDSSVRGRPRLHWKLCL
jgi:ATP-binding cassette subfamily B (MDR/TAP) protein 1